MAERVKHEEIHDEAFVNFEDQYSDKETLDKLIDELDKKDEDEEADESGECLEED